MNPTPHTWTPDTIRALGATTDLVTAGRILGIGRGTTYRLAHTDTFPAPVLRLGTQYRVPVGPLLRLVETGTTTLPDRLDDPPGPSGNGPHRPATRRTPRSTR